MTDISNMDHALRRGVAGLPSRPAYALDETYWGYIVRSQSGTNLGLVMAQVASMFMGAAFTVAALGMWLMPSAVMGEADLLFRAVASILCASGAVLFLWFSSRGTDPELQIDTHQGEVREVIRNRTGLCNLIGRYGFDSFDAVTLDLDPASDDGTLSLRYAGRDTGLFVAEGRASDLIRLRDRLEADMVVSDSRAA